MEADTHTCANPPTIPKGSKHSTGRGNHWTQAYNIDLVALQNATWESKKSRHEIQRTWRSKMPNKWRSKMSMSEQGSKRSTFHWEC